MMKTRLRLMRGDLVWSWFCVRVEHIQTQDIFAAFFIQGRWGWAGTKLNSIA